MATKDDKISNTLYYGGGPLGSETVNMILGSGTSNTFNEPNGSLVCPSGSAGSYQTYTTFTAIPGVFRVVTGTISLNSVDVLSVWNGVPAGVTGNVSGSLLQDYPGRLGSDQTFAFVSAPNKEFSIRFRGSSAPLGFTLTVTSYYAAEEIGEMRNATAKNATGDAYPLARTVGYGNVQVFTSNGTWNKPDNVAYVRVIAIGGGGGGGSGARGLDLGYAGGGAGGGGGGVVYTASFPASFLNATESIVIGAGGTGAAGRATDGASGLTGNTGSSSTFGTSGNFTYVLAPAGTGGGGGQRNAAVTRATSGSSGYGDHYASPNPRGGGSAGAPESGLFIQAGAGGEGGFAHASTPVAPVAGGDTNTDTGGNATGGNAIVGSSGGSGSGFSYARGGAGGGGGSYGVGAIGRAGGPGGNYGGGGGGGGGSSDGFTSGAGGPGAAGIVMVISW
jgi:hypothetical protein